MFDGWESDYGCMRREWADLAGYRRVFGKKSVKNWGTPERPGLTLNLEKFDTAMCRGISFEFPDNGAVTQAMLQYLSKREASAAQELPLVLSGQLTVQAYVYIYAGKNLLSTQVGLSQRAAMVVSARGTSGACFDYVQQTYENLANTGIDDTEVTALWNAVCDVKRTTMGRGPPH